MFLEGLLISLKISSVFAFDIISNEIPLIWHSLLISSESGAIEQDADIVSFIYRPEYYKIEEWDDEERTPTAGQAELIVAKHRNGGLDEIKLKFVGHLGRFENLESFDFTNEFHSRMNAAANDDTFKPENLPTTDEAFGSSINDENAPDDDGDVPF